jgi:hypothetical protein
MAYGTIGDHKANILKKVLAEGKIKVYADTAGNVERTDIITPDGKVSITKDYEQVVRLSKFKRIDIYSSEDSLLESLDIVVDNSLIHSYIFYYRQSMIGRGQGDIAAFLANSLLGEGIDPRLISGSSIDPEVMTTIQNILKGKSY